MRVKLIQLDGALPNIALMKLAHWHRAKGDEVTLTRDWRPNLFEAQPDRVYASAIFDFSAHKVRSVVQEYPQAILGGTGSRSVRTVEQLIGHGVYEHYDYADFPGFEASIGYTQRGCRMSGPKSICRQFCVVPKKEGMPSSVNTIQEIWRGEPWPKKIHLLDNDFFGNPEWRDRVREIREGGFKVCFSQGINARLVTQESAEALASIEYRNTKFNERKLYTAWDNFGDGEVFFRGVERLEAASIPPSHLMAYMLVGCDPEETWERIWLRFNRMVERGIEPYPMVFKKEARPDLVCFQRWAVTGLYRIIPWPDYVRRTKTSESVQAYHAARPQEPPRPHCNFNKKYTLKVGDTTKQKVSFPTP